MPPDQIPKEPWSQSVSDILIELQVDAHQGLSSSEALKRRSLHGPNLLNVEKKKHWSAHLLHQLKSPVVWILLVATVISFLLGDHVDAIAILSIVVLNALIGFFQELKAEAAVDALKKLSAPKGKVFRDGKIHVIEASLIVPGDLLFLEAGDFVPADARILEASQASADEAVLTGESLPVSKFTHEISKETLMADRKNMLFAGTALATGTVRAVVTAIGFHTEIGKIAGLLESTEKASTPLQIRLEEVSQKLLLACGGVVIVVAMLGYFHGETWFEITLAAISLAVAAIPEGLPTVVTLALALAIRRMTRKNAIVKQLPAVETLGSTTVICTDKTGTLTTGQMSVREIFTLQSGLKNLEEDFKEQGSLISSCVLCSNAAPDSNGNYAGDPTEVALLIMAEEHGFDVRDLLQKSPRLLEWSFESDRKRMSVACVDQDQILIHCKGAPEAILQVCQLSQEEKQKISLVINELSGKGRRLLAVAQKRLLQKPQELNAQKYSSWKDVETDLTFLGLVAIADPPRIESIQAVADCRAAGIKVVMITGDHPITAHAIAKELGIVDEKFFAVRTGVELEKMSEKDLQKEVETIAIYARVTPEHKLKIVRAWQALGHVVAMTGDGVNDAPALKQANIGVSMGKGGTEVARQASSMILTDDNFATIVSAVEEGRAIFSNIRRTILYLLSGNLSEILIMFGAALLGWPAPLAPIHLLWINLVTDGLPSLALAAEPVPKDFLKSTNRPSPENFFSPGFYQEMIFIGLTISTFSLILYGISLRYVDEVTARSYAFTFLVFAELLRSFAYRSERKTLFQVGAFSNPYHLAAVFIPFLFQIAIHHFPIFHGVFKVGFIGWIECLALILLTLLPVTVLEVRKLVSARNAKTDSV